MQRQEHSRQKKVQTLLRPIISNQFIRTTIPSEMTIKTFRKNNNLDANRCNMFLEHKNITSKGNIIDVILMDTEVQVKSVFT